MQMEEEDEEKDISGGINCYVDGCILRCNAQCSAGIMHGNRNRKCFRSF